jgi:hypothetical protein
MKTNRMVKLHGGILFWLSLAAAVPGQAQNPVPFIDQPLIPAAAVPGETSFTLVVNGTGFVASSVVHWNASPLATTYVNGNQLTAAVPCTDIATPGTASVTVVSPVPGGGTSNTAYFEITNPTTSVSFQTPRESGQDCQNH